MAVAIAIGVGLVFVAVATGVWDSATQDDGRQSLANFVAVAVLFLGLAVLASGVVIGFVANLRASAAALVIGAALAASSIPLAWKTIDTRFPPPSTTTTTTTTTTTSP